ncbi:hypothetical protein DL770_006409 [Monosporascus sp. CRB-9-2]|nr:hypothetical protein DL770_006409 [Monosporascus sp. CRB-9-2]
MSELDPNSYNVAWIAPLEIEAQSALHMLDVRHRGRFPMGRGDDYVFHAGSMRGHNVVIATLPAGQEYGTGSAAALASQVRKSFPNLWFGLLVGVAAGLPNLSKTPPHDIRLGDVLVALPDGESAGLFAYDLGKATGKDGFQPLRFGHVLATTETVVRSVIGSIKLSAPSDAEIFLPHYENMKNREHATGTFVDPGQHRDKLYEVDDRGEQREVERQRRPDSKRTRVWYGPIGSGEKLMRNSRQRNELRDRYNIIGLEMEAAGTMNRIPVGVIRGVCDYGDEHKNKDWQPYAAAMAAAYAKAILSEISPEARAPRTWSSAESETQMGGIERASNKRLFEEYLASCTSEGPSYDEHAHDRSRVQGARYSPKRQATQRTSTGWKSSLRDGSPPVALNEEQWTIGWPEYQNERPALASRFLERRDIPSVIEADGEAWCTSGRRTPWTVVIYGLAGIGKSQVCLKAISENEKSTYLEISRVCGFQNHWEDIELDEQIRLTRAWLACQKDPWLLMVDNADSTDVTLAKYIPTGGSGTVIITTTDERFATCSSAFGKIRPMDQKSAVDLLMSYKRPGTVPDDTEREAARLLAVNLLGGLPLAIAQAGSYIFNKYCTYAEYCDEFRQSPQGPLSYELEQWPSYRRPIWRTFTISLNRIQNLPEKGSSQAVELLRTLCFLHHEGIQERLFREAWINMKDASAWPQYVALLDSSSPRWDTPDLRAAFEILCRYSLLNHTLSHARQYSLHRLLKVICRESLSPKEQSEYAFRAMSLMATALSGIRAPLPWIENPAGFELQRSLLPHVKACVNDRIKSVFRDQTEEGRNTRAEMLLLYAKAYSSTGHLSDARSILDEVCEGLGVNGSAEAISPVALQAMEQTAACKACLGQHMKACELRRKILNVHEAGPQDPGDHSVAVMNLADSLWMTGHRKEALDMSREVLRRREETLMKNDPKLLRTRRKVAEYLHGSNQRRQALELRESVFADAEARESQSDMEYLDTLASKSALADSYQWDGQLIKSLELREDVYQGRSKILGEEHPDALLAYDRLLGTKSCLVRTTKTQEEICQQREQLVSAWRRMFGDDHPYTLEARVNLGHSYSAIRQWDKALEEQKGVLGIRKRHVREQNLPNNEPNYLSSMGNVANILSKMGNSRDALAMRKSALKAAEECGGADDRMTFKLSNRVASCYAGRDTTASRQTALQMRRSILEKQKSCLQEDDTDILTTMSFLAADLAQLNRNAESIQVRRDLLNKQQSVLGEKNRDTLDNMKKLALALASSASWRQHREAVELMEKAEQFESELLGDDNDKTRNTRVELYRIYRGARENTKARLLARTLKTSGDAENIGRRDLHMISVRDGSDLETDDEEKAQRDCEMRAKVAAIERPRRRNKRKTKKVRFTPRSDDTAELLSLDTQPLGEGEDSEGDNFAGNLDLKRLTAAQAHAHARAQG